MKYLLGALVIILLFPGIAFASGGETAIPTDRPLLTYTMAQTSPYTFEIIDYSSADTEDLSVDLFQVSFVNMVGSIAVTLMALVSEHALLSSVVLIVLAILAMIWVFSVVINQRIDTQLKELGPDLDIYNADIESTEAEFARVKRGGPNQLVDEQSQKLAQLRGRRDELSSRIGRLSSRRQDPSRNARSFGSTARRFRGSSRNPFR